MLTVHTRPRVLPMTAIRVGDQVAVRTIFRPDGGLVVRSARRIGQCDPDQQDACGALHPTDGWWAVVDVHTLGGVFVGIGLRDPGDGEVIDVVDGMRERGLTMVVREAVEVDPWMIDGFMSDGTAPVPT